VTYKKWVGVGAIRPNLGYTRNVLLRARPLTRLIKTFQTLYNQQLLVFVDHLIVAGGGGVVVSGSMSVIHNQEVNEQTAESTNASSILQICQIHYLSLMLSLTCNKIMLVVLTKLVLLLFILTANGFSPGGSGTTIRHDKQITHITQNNTTIKRNTAHKTTHTINTLHRMNTNNYNYNYIN
jgi:hypothetical protein